MVPLTYTQVLPITQLKTVLAAPVPPPTNPRKPSITVRAQSVAPPRAFNAEKLLTPLAIPKKIFDLAEMTAPQIGTSDVATDPNAIPYGIVGSVPGGVPPSSQQSDPAIKPPAKGPIRVGTGVSDAHLIRRAEPLYPTLARQSRVQGIVQFTAIISKEGNIENLHLVRGHPLLVKAAEDAVLQWKYRPTMLNGQPVEVITDIIMNFTLTQ